MFYLFIVVGVLVASSESDQGARSFMVAQFRQARQVAAVLARRAGQCYSCHEGISDVKCKSSKLH